MVMLGRWVGKIKTFVDNKQNTTSILFIREQTDFDPRRSDAFKSRLKMELYVIQVVYRQIPGKGDKLHRFYLCVKGQRWQD